MLRSLFTIFFCSLAILSFGLEISLNVGSFKNDNKPYLETYIRILGETAQFNQVAGSEGQVQAGIEMTMIILQNGQIVSYDRYTLSSPILSAPKDFLDVKRFALAPGAYVLKLEATDINNRENKLELERKVTIASYDQNINLSDIQLFASVTPSDPTNPLSKNGLYLEPLTYGYVSADIDVLKIYTEVYKSADLAQSLFVKYSIIEGFNEKGSEVVLEKYKKLTTKTTEPLLLQLPVNELPSGNYHVEVSLFDQSKMVYATRSIDFVRSNPEYDKIYWLTYNKEEDNSFVNDLSLEELDFALRAISPIVYEPRKSLMDFMVKEASERAKKKFLFSFWKEEAPESPELAFRGYLDVAKAVDLEYNSNVGYGFETDRGYIFLRYGKPNNVMSVDTEVDSYPYEIWYFNYLNETNQPNVRFLFYNKSLVHNDYSLLHSTCRGEKQNPAWEVELYRKGLEVPGQNQIDATNVANSWQRDAKKFFNEF